MPIFGWGGKDRIGIYRYPYKPTWDIEVCGSLGAWWNRRLTLILWRWRIDVLWAHRY